MPQRFGERIKETTITTGTGDVTLAGAVSGYKAFSTICEDLDTFGYTIDDGLGNWEVGRGKYVASGTKLSRVTVVSSSNAGALVNFGAGAKNVFLVKLAISEIPNIVPMAYMEAASSYMALAASAVFTTVPATFTLEWWQLAHLYPAFCGVFAFGSGGDEFMVYTNESNGVVGFGLSLTSQDTILRKNNGIRRISVTRNGTVASVFIDGIRVRTATSFVWGAATGPVISNSQRRMFGDGGSEGSANMGYADVRFWNVVRTDAQIAANALKYLDKGDTTGLVANWPMDEGTGTTCRERIGGFTGTLTNATRWILPQYFPGG